MLQSSEANKIRFLGIFDLPKHSDPSSGQSRPWKAFKAPELVKLCLLQQGRDHSLARRPRI